MYYKYALQGWYRDLNLVIIIIVVITFKCAVKGGREGGHYKMFELKPNEQIFMKLGIGCWSI
jgi:hypothetical protein